MRYEFPGVWKTLKWDECEHFSGVCQQRFVLDETSDMRYFIHVDNISRKQNGWLHCRYVC